MKNYNNITRTEIKKLKRVYDICIIIQYNNFKWHYIQELGAIYI